MKFNNTNDIKSLKISKKKKTNTLKVVTFSSVRLVLVKTLKFFKNQHKPDVHLAIVAQFLRKFIYSFSHMIKLSCLGGHLELPVDTNNRYCFTDMFAFKGFCGVKKEYFWKYFAQRLDNKIFRYWTSYQFYKGVQRSADEHL